MGLVALRLVQPIMLVQVSANVASATLFLSSLHLLYVNTRLLPAARAAADVAARGARRSGRFLWCVRHARAAQPLR